MRVASCFLIAALVSALAGPTNTQTAELAYHSSGTCLASPEGFNSKWEPINSGVTWTTTFASIGRVDAQGAATEIGQAVDTASFGVGPRMHTPAAHSYKVSLLSANRRRTAASHFVRARLTDLLLLGHMQAEASLSQAFS
jgi:hypothetical protein